VKKAFRTFVLLLLAAPSFGAEEKIYPSHLMIDGDAIFTLAIGTRSETPDVNRLGALAADVMSDAIVRAVRAATGIPGYPAARDLK